MNYWNLEKLGSLFFQEKEQDAASNNWEFCPDFEFGQLLETLCAHLRREEGCKLTAYWDQSRWSIGYGSLGYEGQQISAADAELLLRQHAQGAIAAFKRDYCFQHAKFNLTRAVAICGMIYQLGSAGLKSFKKMNSEIIEHEEPDWRIIAAEAIDSKWATQDSPARAVRVARALKTGDIKYLRG